MTKVTSIPQRCLGEGTGGFTPKKKPPVGQGGFLWIVSQMLQNHVGSGMVIPNMIAIIKKDIHPTLVIGIPSPNIPQCKRLCQPLGKVNPIPVHMELLNPKIQSALPKLPGPRVAMVNVRSQSIRVYLTHIKPWISRRWCPLFGLVHAEQGVQSETVIWHHI